jgi:hypothetical protein
LTGTFVPEFQAAVQVTRFAAACTTGKDPVVEPVVSAAFAQKEKLLAKSAPF